MLVFLWFASSSRIATGLCCKEITVGFQMNVLRTRIVYVSGFRVAGPLILASSSAVVYIPICGDKYVLNSAFCQLSILFNLSAWISLYLSSILTINISF